jgi:hypothetical protein
MTQNEFYSFAAQLSKGANHLREPHFLSDEDLDDLEGDHGRKCWMAILDDRTPGTYGPGTFEGPALRKLVASATVIFLDHSVECEEPLYNYFSKEVAAHARLLVIRTNEDRGEAWLDFLRGHWAGGCFDEIGTVADRVALRGRLFMPRLDGDADLQRAADAGFEKAPGRNQPDY